MEEKKNNTIKTATEIGVLAGELSPTFQTYVLNTINALLFAQEANPQNVSQK